MGFFERWRAQSLGNATKCDTLAKKLASKQDKITIISMLHVGSTFALLVIGLIAAAMSFGTELGLKKCSGFREFQGVSHELHHAWQTRN